MSLDTVVSDYVNDVRTCLTHLRLVRMVAQNCFDAVPNKSNYESLKDSIMKHERVQAILDVHEGRK